MTQTLTSKVEQYEKQAIIEALKDCNWVKAQAARKIGITERMIGYKIKKYGIKKEVVSSSNQRSVLSDQLKENS